MLDTISLSEAALAIRRGELNPVDLVDHCLARIDALDERLRAWVLVDAEGACAAAKRRAEAVAQRDWLGPLHGIPLGIKDIVDVQGMPTRAGSPLTSPEPARVDARLVARLRRAGAIILGKTVTTQFACLDPSPTRNPWDAELRHTPGGSSSGSAAAVAAGMCLGAIGSQTGGSLIRPAAYCGLAGCKPTFGRIPLEGVVPVAHHLDHGGVMARTVRDVELLLRCVTGVEEPLAEPTAGELPPPRLGIMESVVEEADEPVCSATRVALERLRACGASIRPLAPPWGFEDVPKMHWRIMAVEAAACHRPLFPAKRESYAPKLASMLDEGLSISGVDYAEALAHQQEFQAAVAEWFPPVDAIVLPATITTAPASLDTTGSPQFQLPWSYAGVPEVCVPCGLASDGMPAAVQFVGPQGADARLLAIAHWAEQCLDFRRTPPLMTAKS